MMSDPAPRSPAALSAHVADEFQSLLRQALAKIHHCTGQLSDAQLWWRPAPGLNSIANLILHLCGNLQQWVVDGVPDRPNQRDRTAEFSADGRLTGPELIARLDKVVSAALKTIATIPAADWCRPRTIQEFRITVLGAVAHSVPHFVGHTHQIIQLTRMQLRDAYQMHWRPENERGSVPI